MKFVHQMKFKMGDRVVLAKNKRYTGRITSIYAEPEGTKPYYITLDRTGGYAEVYEHEISLLPDPAQVFKDMLK